MSDRIKEWLLDTAAVSYVQRGQEPWVSRVLALPLHVRCVPVVAVEEQMRGRLAQVRAAESRRDRPGMLRAYRWLGETASFFADLTIVHFDASALERFDALRPIHRTTGVQDLKIAAIALARGATLVTPNTAHFQGITGLALEDWTL